MKYFQVMCGLFHTWKTRIPSLSNQDSMESLLKKRFFVAFLDPELDYLRSKRTRSSRSKWTCLGNSRDGETSHQKQWPCSGDRCHIMTPVKEVFGMMIMIHFHLFPTKICTGPEPNGPRLVSCNRAAIDTQLEGLILSGSCWRFLGMLGFWNPEFFSQFSGVPNCYAKFWPFWVSMVILQIFFVGKKLQM